MFFWKRKERGPTFKLLDKRVLYADDKEVLEISLVKSNQRIPPATYGVSIFDGHKFRDVP
ncbi:hypothetical protein BCI9360_00205 [Bacillus sp. CECT 9360]|nr:hypothetical protein BCI9360_00205 [Bacillus sp. CECT 9360]